MIFLSNRFQKMPHRHQNYQKNGSLTIRMLNLTAMKMTRNQSMPAGHLRETSFVISRLLMITQDIPATLTLNVYFVEATYSPRLQLGFVRTLLVRIVSRTRCRRHVVRLQSRNRTGSIMLLVLTLSRSRTGRVKRSIGLIVFVGVLRSNLSDESVEISARPRKMCGDASYTLGFDFSVYPKLSLWTLVWSSQVTSLKCWLLTVDVSSQQTPVPHGRTVAPKELAKSGKSRLS